MAYFPEQLWLVKVLSNLLPASSSDKYACENFSIYIHAINCMFVGMCVFITTLSFCVFIATLSFCSI